MACLPPILIQNLTCKLYGWKRLLQYEILHFKMELSAFFCEYLKFVLKCEYLECIKADVAIYAF